MRLPPVLLRDEAASALLAVQFLTRVPIPAVTFTGQRNRGAVKYYPLAGALVGLTAAAVWWLAQFVLPVTLAVLACMTASLLLTGGFHEDGLADTFDGRGATDPARVLEIMRDSRIGTYGVLALCMALLFKAAALTTLSASVALCVCLLVMAHVLSRASSVLVIASSRYVREEGTGKPTAQGISAAGLAVTAGFSVLICAITWWAVGAEITLAALAGTALGHGASRLLYEPRLGGYTGDCLGATQQISELGCYLGGCVGLVLCR